jgi:hypothetical protein
VTAIVVAANSSVMSGLPAYGVSAMYLRKSAKALSVNQFPQVTKGNFGEFKGANEEDVPLAWGAP